MVNAKDEILGRVAVASLFFIVGLVALGLALSPNFTAGVAHASSTSENVALIPLAAATPVHGAPIDSPPPAAPSNPSPAKSATPGSGPDVKPLGRALPQASVDLVQQMEASAKPTAKGGFQRTKDGKYLKLTFSAIGDFHYELPDPDKILASPNPKKPLKEQIPPTIQKLDKQKAVVVGFMVPIDIDGEGHVKSFALTQNQMFCCFGVPPAMNQWVMVSMQGDATKYIPDIPVATFGDFEVGEQIEDGYVMSIYRLHAEKVMDVHELLKQAQANS